MAGPARVAAEAITTNPALTALETSVHTQPAASLVHAAVHRHTLQKLHNMHQLIIPL
jgi:hypothetical protein